MAPIPLIPSNMVVSEHPLVLSPFSEDPITTPGLTVNLVCRVVFGILANFICWVPLRLLYRNGEFAAVVFISNMMGLNVLCVINSLIWRDNNMSEWWAGYGWCDVHPYLYVPMMSLYTTAVLAISRNLCEQVGMLRANPLTVREKRRKNLVQALIMFPIPVLQLAWIYPLTAQRYAIVTLVGCDWRVHGSWPRVIFYIIPAPVVALLSGYFAILTYLRYRELRKSTRGALATNSTAASRQNRTRRRLYIMTLCILVPYVPLQCAHAALNITETFPLESFDFRKIREEAAPYPWDSIVFMPSTKTNFAFMNNKFIPIGTSIIVFFLFGLTQDALNTYRRYLVAIGLDKLFPSLSEMPCRSRGGGSSNFQSTSESWGTQTDTTPKPRVGRLPSYQLSHFGSSSLASGLGSSGRDNLHPSTQLPDLVLPSDREARSQHFESTMLSSKPPPAYPAIDDEPIELPHRNPFLFRTHLQIHLPGRVHLPNFLRWKGQQAQPQGANPQEASPESLRPIRCATTDPTMNGNAAQTECHRTISTSSVSWLPGGGRDRISTRVWSDEDRFLSTADSQQTPLSLHPEPEVDPPMPAAGGVIVQTRITQQHAPHGSTRGGSC